MGGSSSIDFRRQLAEQNAGDRPAKKFKSSAAPKGSRLAAGYTDRTQNRIDEEADDRARRIKALEESYKLGQIEQATFEQLRDQITAGDVDATHLVKGLDRRLLERVRRGEDVLGLGSGDGSAAEKEPEPDVDDEFERLEEKDVAPVAREKKEKKGQTALAGTKRTRDEILAELKAQRKAAAEAKAAAQPQLGTKFRKIGHKEGKFPRIERDEKGREVLITLDEDGNVKRKVRKVKADVEDGEKAPPPGLLMPDKDAKPLGMEVPELPKPPPEDDDDDADIFEGVGDSYDPLAGLGDDDDDDDDDSSEDEDGEVKPPKPKEASESLSATPELSNSTAMPPPPKPSESVAIPKTNYFKNTPSNDASTTAAPANPLTDPTILAAIRKARDINPENLRGDDADAARKDPEEEARLKKRAAMLSLQDRDLEDMDMGFGSSRFDDAEDMEEDGTKIKLSEWKGKGAGADDDDDGEGKKDRGGKQRKRGGKKRKGDKDSAADVLRVMEQRKSGGK